MVDPDRLAELHEERRFLLRSLDDLEREHAAGDVDETDFVALRDGYTARAAQVLHAIELDRVAVPLRRTGRLGRRALTAIAVLAVASGAGVLVARSSGERAATGSLTGGITESVPSLLAEARAQLGPNRAAAARLFAKALAIEPDNAEALTYAAWITRLDTRAALEAGSTTPDAAKVSFTTALVGLRHAISAQPSYPDPHCFEAVLQFRDLADAGAARSSYLACQASNPPPAVAGLVTALGPDIDKALAAAGDQAAGQRVALASARSLLVAGKAKEALDAYQMILSTTPNDVEALAWSGWLVARASGDISDPQLASATLDQGEARIDRALAADPTDVAASCFKAVVLDVRGNDDAAKPLAARCREGGPPRDVGAVVPDLAARLTAIG